MQRCCRLVLPEAICILYLLYFPEVEVVFAGFYGEGIKCRRVVSSRVDTTRLKELSSRQSEISTNWG